MGHFFYEIRERLWGFWGIFAEISQNFCRRDSGMAVGHSWISAFFAKKSPKIPKGVPEFRRKNVRDAQNPIPHNRFRGLGGYTCIVTSDDQMVDKNVTS